MERFRELSPSAQAAYAQLLDAALASDVARSIENLPGSFTSKTIKEKRYWYFQFRDPIAGVRQIYVGPDSKEVQELVKRAPAGRGRNPGPLAPLAKSAVALGCAPVIPRHYRVLKQLSDCGFFRAGGVLAGTHAFLAYGNMLGVHWNDASSTQDVDFVHAGKNIALALSRDFKIKARDAIESLKMGFIPVSGDNGRLGAGYANPTTPDFRLDFLTTLHRGGEKPYEHPSLGLTLQPLKFMELALEDVTQGVIFNNRGAIVVNLPDPIRYAIHKLLVYGERSGSYTTKSRKDLTQAAALISYFRDAGQMEEVTETVRYVSKRGPGWRKRLVEGLEALRVKMPDLSDAVTQLLSQAKAK
jgi:hypothetical protein